MHEHLGGDAADVQAGTAERTALLDTGDLEAFLAGLNSGNVAGNTATNDDQILLLCSGPSQLLRYYCAGFSLSVSFSLCVLG